MNRGIPVWDAIIVGAGPAGSALACLLAKQGRRVLLLDSAVFPREKLCGEYLSPGCLQILEQIGALDEVRRAAKPIFGMRVCSPGGVRFTARYPRGQHGLAIRRTELDGMLVRRAASQAIGLRLATRVEKLLIEDGAVVGVIARSRNRDAETFRAGVTIGADGRNSVVARDLGLFRWRRSHRKTALCVHFEGIEDARPFAEVYLGRSEYGILNPLGDRTANVNLVLNHDELAAAKGRLDDYFTESLARLPALRSRLGSARPAERVRALGPLAHLALRASADGALLIGDAAGFFDPFTGEGVYMALRGAQLAAGVIGRALEASDCSRRFLKQYDSARTEEFRARYRLEALIQTMVRRPALADWVARQLKVKQRAAEALMEVIGGLLHPRHLFSTRFLSSLVWS